MSDEPNTSALVAAILALLSGEYPGTVKIEITVTPTPVQPVVPGSTQEIQK